MAQSESAFFVADIFISSFVGFQYRAGDSLSHQPNQSSKFNPLLSCERPGKFSFR